MARIYISPSTQEHNAYAGGSNEEAQMRAICARVVVKLIAAGHVVRMGGTTSASANAADGNAWGAKIYVAVHSNAGGGEGTEAWYFTGSAPGRRLATAIYNEVARASSAPDRGVKSSTGYVELRVPRCPATIIEVAFHDDASDAAEIRAGHERFAAAIARGILAIAPGTATAPRAGDVFTASSNAYLHGGPGTVGTPFGITGAGENGVRKGDVLLYLGKDGSGQYPRSVMVRDRRTNRAGWVGNSILGR